MHIKRDTFTGFSCTSGTCISIYDNAADIFNCSKPHSLLHTLYWLLFSLLTICLMLFSSSFFLCLISLLPTVHCLFIQKCVNPFCYTLYSLALLSIYYAIILKVSCRKLHINQLKNTLKSRRNFSFFFFLTL